MYTKNKSFNQLNVYKNHTDKKKVNGQLVLLGCDISIYTPATYQRHRL